MRHYLDGGHEHGGEGGTKGRPGCEWRGWRAVMVGSNRTKGDRTWHLLLAVTHTAHHKVKPDIHRVRALSCLKGSGWWW